LRWITASTAARHRCRRSLRWARLHRAEFAQTAVDHAGLDWQKHVKFDERYLRPTEVDSLIGDATKAARSLGWKTSIHTAELARLMVDADIAALECEGKPWIDKPLLPGWS
jgi:GDPmannose 4,6-dehydratase